MWDMLERWSTVWSCFEPVGLAVTMWAAWKAKTLLEGRAKTVAADETLRVTISRLRGVAKTLQEPNATSHPPRVNEAQNVARAALKALEDHGPVTTRDDARKGLDEVGRAFRADPAAVPAILEGIAIRLETASASQVTTRTIRGSHDAPH